ncbi:MAG TPA: pyridoxamine 5'-phosphate oxidase family protein [Terriglobales bacterium]|nr:pyridoxamine 5'-phosphate oxidase family protein [Terriglobales bacterium]
MPVKKSPQASRPYMPGYGLPKGQKGLLPWTWAKQRLEKSHNYWIATSRPDGSPHLMVIWGLWMDGAFLFSTGEKSRKGRNLAHNPRCVIGTDKSAEAVIVEGTVEVNRDEKLRKKFNRAYQKKYKWDMSTFKDPVYVLRPSLGFGFYEKDFLGKATRWRFSE